MDDDGMEIYVLGAHNEGGAERKAREGRERRLERGPLRASSSPFIALPRRPALLCPANIGGAEVLARNAQKIPHRPANRAGDMVGILSVCVRVKMEPRARWMAKARWFWKGG